MRNDARANPAAGTAERCHPLGSNVVVDDVPMQDVDALTKDDAAREGDFVLEGDEMKA